MRIPLAILSGILLLLITACSNEQSKATQQQNLPDSSATQPLYPFAQYLANELAYIDSMPLAIEQVTRQNGQTIDSGFVDKAVFKSAVVFFTSIDPNKTELRSQYIETSFNDLSTESITFSISASNAALPLQQADVLLNPNTQQVKSVALKINQQTADSSITTQVLWKHHMKCQLAQTIDYKDGQSINRITEYVWDKPL
jgi:hypothetical protein